MMSATVAVPRSEVLKELRAIMHAVQPGALDRLIAVAERSERAAADARAAVRELDGKRREHHEAISREKAEADAALSKRQAEWNSEEARRRAALEQAEAAIARLKEQAEGDSRHAAAWRRDLQERLAKMSELAA
jgi:hypothetical protein